MGAYAADIWFIRNARKQRQVIVWKTYLSLNNQNIKYGKHARTLCFPEWAKHQPTASPEALLLFNFWGFDVIAIRQGKMTAGMPSCMDALGMNMI